jgi:hypothetical protein
MYRFIWIFVVFFMPLFGGEPTNEELASIKLISQILKAKEIWPGYQIKSAPTIITFKNGHVFAFGLNSANPSWKTLSPGIQYADHDEWNAAKTPMQANFIIENQRSFVFQIDHSQNEAYEKPFMVFVHERFHQYQFDAFASMKQRPSKGYFDHMNSDNLVFMQIEEKILLDYLTTGNQDKLRDYVAVNQHRRTLIDMQSSLHEIQQQVMEGLADYVSIKIFDETPIFPGFSGRHQLIATLEKYASHPDITQRAIKWRHYGVGAALGYALDDLHVADWKENVQRKMMSQEEQLELAFGMTENEMAVRLEKVKSAYRYEELKLETSAVVKAYKMYLDELMTNFSSLPGVEMTVGRIRYAGQSGGGMSKRLINLNDGSILALEDDSFASSSDNAWHLRLDKVPFALKGRAGEITFKVERELSISLDGNMHTAQEIVENARTISFMTIGWQGQKTSFACEQRPGKIRAEGNHITVDFD